MITDLIRPTGDAPQQVAALETHGDSRGTPDPYVIIMRRRTNSQRRLWNDRSVACRRTETRCQRCVITVYSPLRANPSRGGDAKPPVSGLCRLPSEIAGLPVTRCTSALPTFVVQSLFICPCSWGTPQRGIARYGLFFGFVFEPNASLPRRRLCNGRRAVTRRVWSSRIVQLRQPLGRRHWRGLPERWQLNRANLRNTGGERRRRTDI